MRLSRIILAGVGYDVGVHVRLERDMGKSLFSFCCLFVRIFVIRFVMEGKGGDRGKPGFFGHVQWCRVQIERLS